MRLETPERLQVISASYEVSIVVPGAGNRVKLLGSAGRVEQPLPRLERDHLVVVSVEHQNRCFDLPYLPDGRFMLQVECAPEETEAVLAELRGAGV